MWLPSHLKARLASVHFTLFCVAAGGVGGVGFSLAVGMRPCSVPHHMGLPSEHLTAWGLVSSGGQEGGPARVISGRKSQPLTGDLVKDVRSHHLYCSLWSEARPSVHPTPQGEGYRRVSDSGMMGGLSLSRASCISPLMTPSQAQVLLFSPRPRWGQLTRQRASSAAGTGAQVCRPEGLPGPASPSLPVGFSPMEREESHSLPCRSRPALALEGKSVCSLFEVL